MPFEVLVTATSLPVEVARSFVADARGALDRCDELRRSKGIPEFEVQVLLTDEFVPAVESLRAAEDGVAGDPFTTDRVGGTVWVKTLERGGDPARPIIVCDAGVWAELRDINPALASVHTVYLVSQQLGYQLLRRARDASGVPRITFQATPSRPNASGRLVAHDLTRKVSNEYRANALALGLAGRAVRAGALDGRSLGEFSQAMAIASQGQLAEELEPLYPTWPDAVQAYREWRLGLGEMFFGLVADLDPELTFLATTQAHADAAGVPGFFEQEPFASIPAVRLYLAAPWSAFMRFLRSRPSLPDLARIPQHEADLLAAGEAMVRAIWANLGLTVPEHPNGQLEVRVSAPRR